MHALFSGGAPNHAETCSFSTQYKPTTRRFAYVVQVLVHSTSCRSLSLFCSPSLALSVFEIIGNDVEPQRWATCRDFALGSRGVGPRTAAPERSPQTIRILTTHSLPHPSSTRTVHPKPLIPRTARPRKILGPFAPSLYV